MPSPKALERLTACADQGLRDLAGLAHQAHAAPAATGHRLDQQREAQLERFLGQTRVVLLGAEIARRAGHAGIDHAALGQRLVAHGLDGARGRADKDQAGVPTRLGKPRVFAQEAVAGVDGIGAGLAGRFQQRVNPQVRVSGSRSANVNGLVSQANVGRVPVGVTEDGDRAVAEVTRRAHDAAGNLAAVGDQDL